MRQGQRRSTNNERCSTVGQLTLAHRWPTGQPNVCGTLKCENAAICEKVAKCEKKSTLNVKIDAICEKITLNVKK